MLRCLIDGWYSGIVLSIRPLTVTLADKDLGLLRCGAVLLLEHFPTIWSVIVSTFSRVQQSHNVSSEQEGLFTRLQNVTSKKVWILSNIVARITYLLSFLFSEICMSLIYELGVTAEVWVMSVVVHKMVSYLGWLDNYIWLQKSGLCLRLSIKWCHILGG